MAIFNPVAADVQSPDARRYSQLSGAAPGGLAIKTAALTLDTGIKTADAVLDKNVQNQVNVAVDKVHALYGSDAATPNASDENLPPNLTAGINKLDTLYQGYANGSIKESHMYGLLNAYVKQIKANNPGYEDNVDKWMASKGYRPANQIVGALRDEAMQGLAQRNQLAKDRLDYEESKAGKIEMAYPGYFVNPEIRNMPFDNLKNGVAQVEAKESSTSLAASELQLKISNGNAQKQDYEVYARKATANYVAVVSSALGEDFEKKILEYQKSGKSPTPEELQQLTGLFAAKKAEMIRGISKMLSEDKTQTWFQLDQSVRTDILASATAPLDAIGDAITSKDYGLAAMAGNLSKAQADSENAKLLGIPDIRRFSSVKNLLGDVGAGLIIQRAQKLDALSQAVVSGEIVKTLDPSNPQGQTNWSVKSSFDMMSNAEKMGTRLDPKTYKAVIDSNVDILKSPSVSSETKSRIVQYLFGNNDPEFLNMFKEGQKEQVYANLVNPEVTKTIETLSEGHPQIWQNYSNWAYRSFGSLTKGIAGDLNQVSKNDLSKMIIRYNPSRAQIEAYPNEAMFKSSEDPLGLVDVQDTLKEKFRQLNVALSSIKPVMEHDHLDMATSVKQLFQQMGVPLSQNDDEKGKAKDTISGGQTSQDLRGSAGTDTLDTQNFLDFIGQAEGADYNTMYGETPGATKNSLTNMTINEVMDLQKSVGGSGAAGKYQIQRATLSDLKKGLGLSGDEYYTTDMQDYLAQALLQRRGLEGFASGKMTKEQYANELSKEWASLPSRNGQSYWQGVGGNKANASLEEVYTQLSGMTSSDSFKPTAG